MYTYNILQSLSFITHIIISLSSKSVEIFILYFVLFGYNNDYFNRILIYVLLYLYMLLNYKYD